MARLLKTRYPGDWEFHGDLDEYRVRTDALLDAIPRKVKFSVADGYAYYAVVKDKPLTLQHIPYCDGYQISPAHIRGLRLADIKHLEEGERLMAELFKRKENA